MFQNDKDIVSIGHQASITCLAFSPDGLWMLTGSWDGTAKIWDVSSGNLQQTFSWGAERINDVAWSPDGNTIALAGSRSVVSIRTGLLALPRDVRLYSVSDGSLLALVQEAGDRVDFSPDSRKLVTATNSQVSVLETVPPRGTYSVDTEGTTVLDVLDVLFSIDGKALACVYNEGVLVLDAGSLKPRFLATDMQLFNPPTREWDARRLVSFPFPTGLNDPIAMYCHLIWFWKRVLPEFRPFKVRFGAFTATLRVEIAFSLDGERAALVGGWEHLFGERCFVPVVDAKSCRRNSVQLGPVGSMPTAATFSPDGKTLALAGGEFHESGEDRIITLFDVSNGHVVKRFGHGPVAISSLACSGSLVAVGGGDGSIVLCNVDQGRVLAHRRLRDSAVVGIEFCRSAEAILVSTADGIVSILSLSDLNCTYSFRTPFMQLCGGMTCGQRERFVGVGYLHRPKPTFYPVGTAVCSLRDGRTLTCQVLPGKSSITSVSPSHDQMRLVVSCWTHVAVAEVGDSGDDVALRVLLEDDSASISCASFTSDNAHILVGMSGRHMTMVDANSGAVRYSLRASYEGPTSFAFTASGSRLARASRMTIEIFGRIPEEPTPKHFMAHTNIVTSLVFRDERHLVSGGWDGELRVWDAESGTLQSSMSMPRSHLD